MKDFFALRIRPWAAITVVGFYACIGSLAQYTNRFIEARDDNFGIALLSRLAGPPPALIYFGSAKLPSIVADFTHAGQDFHVLATHPLPPWGASILDTATNICARLRHTAAASTDCFCCLGASM